MPESTKRCSECHETKPLSEFNKRAASPDGHAYKCKVCERAIVKANYHKRKERLGRNLYYEMHKDDIRRKSKEYYEGHKEHLLDKNKEYRQKHPEVHAKSVAKRKRLIDLQKGKPYTRGQIIDRDSVTVEGKKVVICQVCKKAIDDLNELEIDHILPVGQGGLDCYDNVRCVHKTCNVQRPLDGRDEFVNE